MRKTKSIYFLFFLVLSLSLVSATDWGYGSSDGITIITNANLSTANVNNSLYWQGHTGTDGSWLTGISNWIKTTNIAGSVTLHPDNLSQNVGVGTNNSAYDLEVRNLDGDNTALGISSGTGNSNASLFFREADTVRYKIFYDGRTSLFNLYSFAIDKILLSFDTTGKAEFSQNVNIVGNLTAPNICLSNGTGCGSINPFDQVLNKTSNVKFNDINATGNITAVWGFFHSINVSNDSIYVGGVKISSPDGSTLNISSNVSSPYFKGDGSQLTNLNLSGISFDAGTINASNFNGGNFTGNYFTAAGDITASDAAFSGINITGHAIINSSKGQEVHLDNFVVHTQELMTDTLLDKFRSSLSCVGGQLNYTLYAVYGDGQFNFNGTLYPSDHTGVDNATITLTCGTDITPVANYIYWELVAGFPTMKTASSYPSGNHIDVATFVVGACSGTSYTIYSYSRNRYEVDSFVKRVIQRFEDSGTLYVSGFNPNANTTELNVTSGGEFFNGIFEMTSTNTVKLSEEFYFINSTGNFKQATSLSVFTQYSNGVPFSGGPNERINIVWGVVPINITGGVGPTQMRLVAVLSDEPTVKYNTVAEAIADIYDTTNYFPPNSDVKNVFVPIARTIIRPNTDVFEPFNSGLYYQDIRGMTGGGGGSSSATSVNYWSLNGETISPIVENYSIKANSLIVNNTNGMIDALVAYGNLNSYFQFNIRNSNNGSSASSDIVATANNGNETSAYIDMGINSANYSEQEYNITGANDGYLYIKSGHLAIGTATVNKIIKFFVGGVTTSNEIFNVTTSGIQSKANITASYFKLNEGSGDCDLTRNHTICSNLSGTFIIGISIPLLGGLF